jgi:hypothetical protein
MVNFLLKANQVAGYVRHLAPGSLRSQFTLRGDLNNNKTRVLLVIRVGPSIPQHERVMQVLLLNSYVKSR